MFLTKLFTKKTSGKPLKTDAKANQKERQRKSNRKGELGEYKIDIQLAQLPKDCEFISDLMIKNAKSRSGFSQVDHVIVTPFGLFVIETKNYQGKIYGNRERKKWRINGKFEMYNPFLQNFGHIKAIQALLPEYKDVAYISIVSFTKRCTFAVDPELRKIQSNELIVYDTELSEFIQRKLVLMPKLGIEPCLSSEAIKDILERLTKANITDSSARETHIAKIKDKIEKTNTAAKPSRKGKCKTCGKGVSEKVEKFCLSQKQRFGGNIYCYEHQQND
ncbi:MAG TPA: nuclease-related domain-containing protein [Bacillales bacterium]|nr:nuclease-related domain-containing protein [Bacillales bacterium]